MKLSEIAALVEGQLIGPDLEVNGVAELKDAQPDKISFFTNPKYLEAAKQTRAAAVIIGEKSSELTCAQIVCRNSYLALAKTLTILYPPSIPVPGVHPSAVIEKDASLGNNVSVSANVYIGMRCKLGNNVVLRPNVVLEDDVEIGDNSWIYSNVSIREKVKIGQRVIIHSGTVIGGDGFGYAPQSDGIYYKIPQIGTVIIEDDVEIGANVTIDRATIGRTIIGRGAKIDNLVMVAHNVEVGENTILIAQVGISGSTKIGKHCTLAGQVGVAGHLNIGDNVIVAAQSGVTKNIAANQTVAGFPAAPIAEDRRKMASLAMLPDKMKQIEARLKKLEAQMDKKETEEENN